MKFYTNIQLIGNQFLIRGYENGKHITHREEWKPTLFVPSKRKTKYKTLEGDSVEPIQPGFVRDCREFYKKYDEVENFAGDKVAEAIAEISTGLYQDVLVPDKEINFIATVSNTIRKI